MNKRKQKIFFTAVVVTAFVSFMFPFLGAILFSLLRGVRPVGLFHLIDGLKYVAQLAMVITLIHSIACASSALCFINIIKSWLHACVIAVVSSILSFLSIYFYITGTINDLFALWLKSVFQISLSNYQEWQWLGVFVIFFSIFSVFSITLWLITSCILKFQTHQVT